MKRLVIDLDDTLTVHGSAASYADKAPNAAVIDRLREYQAAGFEIVIFSSRNMRTYQGAVGKINVHTLPVMLDWLNRHDVPFDEVIVGKPWCGHEGFYVDDRAIRPSEFVSMSLEQIQAMLGDAQP